ncbi:sugar phosphate isomerase/epimerase [Mammaliicoccus sciuri]|uniref:sugar phosphate isomerase/epimerase family protein n=1 Tax=Mammaliicoccus sciuri TaxID=1296 RepID=UPI001FB4C202|nr:sugar phosphate isomerase/epimerase [Mammaliicoccus sciuri]MCJ1779462.1 sugar phosphate isomerase/epimerase [Mammaliicoccus sciuri]UXU83599.1 sugar phosphate isomerase/epimerase [Mammaliicoccus sciuri]UXU93445.1 sugar phosphate isomerase/epimerase [Mammaliicoccus sciuri]UXV15393.1 sugar phosphate isomerase/epimerase [Mammaliicoccus sciuri]UXV23658.1 sugar phosphate isomerase/epimerase [Mammaliicoccus sciuri]
MKLSYVTDSLPHLTLEEVLEYITAQGIYHIELATGGWSPAPHLNLNELLNSETELNNLKQLLSKYNVEIIALNCSGNPLDPGEIGNEHRIVTENTFELAEKLGVKTIVMMSGLPPASAEDKMPNWITYTVSWPPQLKEALNYQWNDVAIPYWKELVEKAKKHGIEKIALENFSSQLVYNPETLLKLRNAVDPMIGMNLDPSHLLWMGADPIQCARALEGAIHHVHGKDVRIEKGIAEVNTLLETKEIDDIKNRAWNYVAVGYGQDLQWWKTFFSVVRMVGYDGFVSLEMEDLTMSPEDGVKVSIEALKSTVV